MRSLANDLVAAGQLVPSDRDAFVTAVHEAARAGRFSMALTMSAVVAEAPRAPDPQAEAGATSRSAGMISRP